MKNTIARFALFTLVFVCLGCAAHTPAEKEAVHRAATLNFPGSYLSGERVVAGDLVVVISGRNLNIVRVDGVSTIGGGISNRNVTFVFPGERTLGIAVEMMTDAGPPIVAASGHISTSISMSGRMVLDPVDMPFVFEKGKHYRLDYKMALGGANLACTEITEADELAKVAEYFREYNARAEQTDSYHSFSRLNPDWLEGKWTVGPDKDELAFSGNTVKYVAPKTMLISARNTLEGTFIFDQNTIVILWDTFSTFLSTVKRTDRPDAFEKTAWAYTLTGDTLEIKNNGTLFPADIGGTYKRVK